MFYPYLNNQMRIPAGYGASVTQSGAQSTIQAVQQALQAQQQAQQMQQSMQPYYLQYYYPMHSTQYGISISTIPYGTEYNL
ncbi:DUF3947 family protein [Bacillus sp. BP-3]|uniref:DUF3947 family protein n=1 Tax=Bacillus sp. BP-3 TaxID=3022773 RepID=UPI002330F9AC|nr:DUF3947 family protein [Bacillus sp. BP-3]MDC2867010.1 DUF3947 family protein [Bacillus sp. BP-3]